MYYTNMMTPKFGAKGTRTGPRIELAVVHDELGYNRRPARVGMEGGTSGIDG